jgi:phosphoribosylamine--glycine ligase
MKLLVVGSGGREHAIVRRLAVDPYVTDLVCAPGNAGICRDARCVPADPGDPPAVLDLVLEERIDLTIVGPELPLDRGIVDLFQRAGRRILGPTRAAARLECSKVFAKDFMTRHGIPTARYRACGRLDDALELIERGELGLPVVIKADGLAAGKGVVVAADAASARAAIRSAMEDRVFGDAGTHVVIEECLSGPEISFFALCDGRAAIPLSSAQDHKRIFDDDRGPNTGGMGAFSPSPLVDDALQARIMDDIVNPVLRGMQAEGHEYRGFLYAGLMLTCNGPRVIEFNVRFGDPEAQVVLPLLEGAIVPVLAAAADGNLGDRAVARSADSCVGVVLASAGYPGSVKPGVPIHGIDDAEKLEGVSVLHAGTAVVSGFSRTSSSDSSRTVTAGGRVLTVVGRAATWTDAIGRAYAGVSKISFDGMQYRKDIGAKAKLEKEAAGAG